MISTTRFFVYISCSHQDQNLGLSWHHSSHPLGIQWRTPSQHKEATPEKFKLSVVAHYHDSTLHATSKHFGLNTKTILRWSTDQDKIRKSKRGSKHVKHLVKGCVHVLPTRASRFWSIFPFTIKHIFPCSFENKCMRLLTCVHGISDFQDKFRVWIAVLGRIQTSDHCIFKSCHCVQSAIVQRVRLIAM